MTNQAFDLVIIGSGPGGYVAAIRASQLGMNVAVVEKEHLGGICLNWGCIPTKALLKSAEVYSSLANAKRFGVSVEKAEVDFTAVVKRSRQIATRMSKGVEFLLKKNNVKVFKGFGKFLALQKIGVINESGDVVEELTGSHIIIATGARPRTIPGVKIDRKRVISSREAMSLEKFPESMIVIGAGAIGVEFAYFYQTLGCQVTVVEMLPHVLPIEDAEVTELLTRAFKKQKMKIFTSTMVKSVVTFESGVRVIVESNGESKDLEAELALMAIGVQGNYENLGLEELGIEVEKSYIKVNEYCQTNIKNIYAIGDIIGPPWLAHVASAEGILAVEKIAGKEVKPIDYASIPGCTYCKPQVASIGLTEKKAIEQGYEIRIGRFPFVASGKSIASGENEGMVKLIYDAKTDTLLGAHIIHAEATELIGELSILKTLGIEGEKLIKTIHAHPTLSEAIQEAAAAAHNEAIHL